MKDKFASNRHSSAGISYLRTRGNTYRENVLRVRAVGTKKSVHISKLPTSAIKDAKIHLKNLFEQSGWDTVSKALLYVNLDFDSQRCAMVNSLERVGVKLEVGDGREIRLTDRLGTQSFRDDRWYSGLYFALFKLIGTYDLYFPFYSEGFDYASLSKLSGKEFDDVTSVRLFLCTLRASGEYKGFPIKMQGGDMQEVRQYVYKELEQIRIGASMEPKRKPPKVSMLHLLLENRISDFFENFYRLEQTELDFFFKTSENNKNAEKQLLREVKGEYPMWFDGSLDPEPLALLVGRWIKQDTGPLSHIKWSCLLRSLSSPGGLKWRGREFGGNKKKKKKE